ncbi:hypothetical protein FE789_02670 [Burkholderia pseudomallei]|nr:hypothetical protein FE789_02670 [Burkholderia pseudomallei]
MAHAMPHANPHAVPFAIPHAMRGGMKPARASAPARNRAAGQVPASRSGRGAKPAVSPARARRS